MSEVQPFTPATDLLRHLLVGTPLEHPAAIELLKLVLFALVALAAGPLLSCAGRFVTVSAPARSPSTEATEKELCQMP